jgi:hypothetical protein
MSRAVKLLAGVMLVGLGAAVWRSVAADGVESASLGLTEPITILYSTETTGNLEPCG